MDPGYFGLSLAIRRWPEPERHRATPGTSSRQTVAIR
jgi:hypothetical protein